MATAMIRITNKTTGEIQNIDPAKLGTYDAAVWQQVGPALPVGLDWDSITLVGGVWVEDAAKVEAALVTAVKAENERRVRTIYSTNFGKQKKYARKNQEVLDYRALGGAASSMLTTALSATVFTSPFSLMTIAQRQKKFRFAMAQATKRGVSIDVIIGEFETAIETNEAQIASWEAIELEAIRAIKAAQTAATKRAAYAAIDWNWTA